MHNRNLPEIQSPGPLLAALAEMVQMVRKRGQGVNRDAGAFLEYPIDIFERFH